MATTATTASIGTRLPVVGHSRIPQVAFQSSASINERTYEGCTFSRRVLTLRKRRSPAISPNRRRIRSCPPIMQLYPFYACFRSKYLIENDLSLLGLGILRSREHEAPLGRGEIPINSEMYIGHR